MILFEVWWFLFYVCRGEPKCWYSVPGNEASAFEKVVFYKFNAIYCTLLFEPFKIIFLAFYYALLFYFFPLCNAIAIFELLLPVFWQKVLSLIWFPPFYNFLFVNGWSFFEYQSWCIHGSSLAFLWVWVMVSLASKSMFTAYTFNVL